MEPSTIHHLEMTDREDLRPGRSVEGMEVVLVDPPDATLNQRLYREVGGSWQWTDRLVWATADWRTHVERPELVTGIGRMDGQTVGYFELEVQAGGNVQIQYFGLMPEWIGRGLGGALLTAAIRTAWSLPGARRVWVHTCNNDHPHALANYQKRGFTIFHVESA